jgi:hypothetical protein
MGVVADKTGLGGKKNKPASNIVEEKSHRLSCRNTNGSSQTTTARRGDHGTHLMIRIHVSCIIQRRTIDANNVSINQHLVCRLLRDASEEFTDTVGNEARQLETEIGL